MSEKFDWKKVFDVSLSALGKSTSVWIKGGLVTFAIIIIGWSLWNTFNPKPTKTTEQNAHEICNNYNTVKPIFGCSAVHVYMKANNTTGE